MAPQGIFVRTALSADDMEWLRAESDKLGITPGQFIRVIVRHMRESGAIARFDINLRVPKVRGRSPTYEELVRMDDAETSARYFQPEAPTLPHHSLEPANEPANEPENTMVVPLKAPVNKPEGAAGERRSTWRGNRS
jgi:hypothetical protein